MTILVLTEWQVGNTNRPLDAEGNFVRISGRRAGLVHALLAMLGIDPTTSFKVSPDRVEVMVSSLSGREIRIIPLGGVCSIRSGSAKPWRESLALMFLLTMLAVPFRTPEAFFLLGIFGALCGLMYFSLNRTIAIGIVEKSGHEHLLQFKRSVIEGISVDELQGLHVGRVVQHFVEQKQRTP